jgi:hypothetical protein
MPAMPMVRPDSQAHLFRPLFRQLEPNLTLLGNMPVYA